MMLLFPRHRITTSGKAVVRTTNDAKLGGAAIQVDIVARYTHF